jgi:putative phosphoesterase
VRVAVISDVHGNLPALEAVLDEVDGENPDVIVSCGDVASGPMPAETIDMLQRLSSARFVRGNADRGLIEEFDGTPPSPILASFEASLILDGVDGIGRVLFCHATPRNDTDVMLAETPDDRMREHLAGVSADMVVCGHTHMQFDRTVGGVRVVNAGSVGMTYGEPGAYWAMLGPGLSLRRTDYDREAAARRIRTKDWLGAEEFATRNVITPPSIEEAMTFMRALEAKQKAARA